MYNPIRQVLDNKLNVRLKIFYFTLEMAKEEKMLQAFSNMLYLKEGIRLDSKDLKSTRADKPVSKEVLDLIKKHKSYFKELENTVEFVDSVRNPYGIYNFMRDYAKNNGIQHKKKLEFVNNRTGEITERLVDDYYEPHDPEEYVIIIIDHISLEIRRLN